MQKGNLTRETRRHGSQRFLNRPFEEMRVVRDAFGVGRHPPFENEDLPVRQVGPQMVERPAIAQPQFEDGAREVLNKVDGVIQAGALGLQAPDKAVKPAHKAGPANR